MLLSERVRPPADWRMGFRACEGRRPGNVRNAASERCWQSVCVALRIVVVVVLVTACSSNAGPATSNRPSSSTERSTGTTIPTARATALDCHQTIGEINTPGNHYEVIGDAVALVTARTSRTALQTSRTGNPDPSTRLFAKNGLLVRTGVRSELIVPSAWRGRLSFEWANITRQATDHLVVGPCQGISAWSAFPGGYLVSDPACVNFIVRTSSGDHYVTAGVGAACPGQRGPPEPTDH